MLKEKGVVGIREGQREIKRGGEREERRDNATASRGRYRQCGYKRNRERDREREGGKERYCNGFKRNGQCGYKRDRER